MKFTLVEPVPDGGIAARVVVRHPDCDKAPAVS